MKSPIIGASTYLTRSPHAGANRLVNLYAEIAKEGKSNAFLTRTPGLVRRGTAGTGPCRGTWQFGDYGYMVSGDRLYQIDVGWNATIKGTVLGSGPVSMADNGTQLFIACGARGYIYNATTDAFQEITDPHFAGARTAGYLDGYFVFNEPETQTVWITSLLDGLAIDPLDFQSAEGFPDDLVAVVIDHREAWLFGKISTEVWYNSGNADFPLTRVQGAMLEVGIASPYCCAKLDNSLMWLGNDGIVYRADGYTPKRKSTHALESWIERHVDIRYAEAWSYRQDGHQFYVLSFPGAMTSWAYDVATDEWAERASWIDGAFGRTRATWAMTFNRSVVVGDYLNGNFYTYSLDAYDEDGEILKWLRAWRALPPGENDLKRQSHHSLQLDIQAGVGLQSGQGSDPQVMLRFSNDGGRTWGNEHWRSMGAAGNTQTRVIWRRLGGTEVLRDRVYEVSGTDPVPIIITGAELDVEVLRD